MIKVKSNHNHRYPLIYHYFTCNQTRKIQSIDREKQKVPEKYKMLPKGPFEIWELPKPRTVYKTYQCTEIFSSLGFWQKWIFRGD